MMEPPPAPIEDTATVGMRSGKSAMCSSELNTGRPLRMTPMSALVPPTSIVIKLASVQPTSIALAAAPATPAAGPESSATAGRLAIVASSSMPPFERAPRAGVSMPRAARPALSPDT